MTVVLASTSPTRAAMLRNVGLEVETAPARVDEDEVKAALRAEGVSPRDQADHLAERKALRVSARMQGRLVIGADQVLECEGEAFDKPRDRAGARAQLMRLRGARHRLFTAAVVALDGAPLWRHVATARLQMRPFSEAFLETYLDRIGDGVLETVGGYKIEEAGAQLFSRVEGDWFAILGLPLLELLAWLRIRGEIAE